MPNMPYYPTQGGAYTPGQGATAYKYPPAAAGYSGYEEQPGAAYGAAAGKQERLGARGGEASQAALYGNQAGYSQYQGQFGQGHR